MRRQARSNRESVGLQNDLRRLCQHYVYQHHPGVYKAFQDALGIQLKFLDPRLQELMDIALGKSDGCEICHGANGGAPGNLNVVGGVKMCDYCHALRLKKGQEQS